MLYSLGKAFIRLITWLDLILASMVLYLLSFLPQRFIGSRYRGWFQKWCWIFIRALGVDIKIHQKNHFPLPAQYIVIGNHPSVLEDLGMSAVFNARFLAKEQIKKWWIVGRISIAIGTLFVERESKESRKQASLTMIQALQQGHNIGVYPEGGCKGRRIHLPFHYGSFDAAIQTGIPIIPVFLHYEAQEAFEWRDEETLLQILWKIFNSPNKTANYYIYDAIDPKRFADKDTLSNYVSALYMNWQTQYLE